jgi:hypothetical protein
MIYLAIFGSLLFIVLLIAFNVRTDHWRNRRSGKDRRKIPDRRVNPGRRKRNVLEHESKLVDRRRSSDRRVGPVTRRHKKRRAEDRFVHR